VWGYFHRMPYKPRFMTFRALIFRSLRFHARAHLGVVLVAAVGSAALIGALVVGDSVRGSLQELALQRLGKIHYAMAPSDRFFRAEPIMLPSPRGPFFGAPVNDATGKVAQAYEPMWAVPALKLPATATARNSAVRANHVQVLGIPNGVGDANGRSQFINLVSHEISKLGGGAQLSNLADDSVALNEALAAQLKVQVGDTVLLRVNKPTALSQDAVVTPRSDSSVALRLRVQVIIRGADLGNFNLAATQVPPFNAFMNLKSLADHVGLPGRANLLLSGPLFMLPGSARFAAGAFSFRPRPPTPIMKAKTLLGRWAPTLFGSSPAPEIADPTNAVAFLNWSFRMQSSLADMELELRQLSRQRIFELRSTRVFLDASLVDALHKPGSSLVQGPGGTLPPVNTNYTDVLTYLINEFQAGERATPYSMATAIGAPVAPADMGDDEILINQWLAEDLQIAPGADLALTYFLPDSGSRLGERTNHFRVRAVVPMQMPFADRTLMPEFPGIAKAESTHDWDAGFPLVHKIRDKDEQYWKQSRGTPKAFMTLAGGQKMWANRFGDLTAIRFHVPTDMLQPDFERTLEQNLLSNLNPAELGLRFEPVRAQALAAANQAQDFGQLFLGFSFFLILAALILIGLLFQFGLEQRITEVGTLLALGFTVKQIRRLLLWEGTALAIVGAVIGVLGGIGYARAMLAGLTTIWRGAVGTSALHFHLTASSLLIGLCASVVVSAVTIWLVLRKQAQRPALELLA